MSKLQTDTNNQAEMCRYAVTTIRERLDKMLSHIDGVREGKETEPVHQMRVWSRRTRAALDVFRACFPTKGFETMEREVKRATRALGAARDLDVMIMAQEKRLANLPPEQRAGLEAFLDTLRKERTEAQDQLIPVADHLETVKIGEQFDALAERAHSSHETPFLAMAAYTIDLRLYEMESFVPYLAHPDYVLQLHEMRIAAKHLRYTLEIFAAPFAEQAHFDGSYTTALNQVKGLQEALGNLHDADVLVPRLARFAAYLLHRGYDSKEESVGVHRVDFGAVAGLIALCQTVAAERNVVYDQLVKDWRKIEKDRVFETLRRNLQETIEKAESASRSVLLTPNQTSSEDASALPYGQRQTETEGANALEKSEESYREQKGDIEQVTPPAGSRQRRTPRRPAAPAANHGGTAASGTDPGSRSEKSRVQ